MKVSQINLIILICSFFFPLFSLAVVNRIDFTSRYSLYYSFPSDNQIQFKFSMKQNTGWVAIGFGQLMTNTDMIRVYMDGTTPKADDLWSTGNIVPTLDTIQNLQAVSGSRTNNILTITVNRPLNTDDPQDFIIIPETTIDLIYAIAIVDTVTTKHVDKGSIQVIFTKTQICDSACTSCQGPESTDCTCGSGKYFDQTTKTCKNCIQNCDQCVDGNTCTTCANNYYYLSATLGSCTLCTAPNQYKDNVVKTCTVCDTNCAECSSDINCKTCIDGYFKPIGTNSKCKICTLANCKSCPSDVCQSCISGYIFNNNVCDLCPSNCADCTSSTSCKKCNANYYLQTVGSNKNCVSCSSSGQFKTGLADGTGECGNCITNCLVCNDASTCSSCSDGYIVNTQNKCDKCTVLNCKKCDPIETCKECSTGYTLNTNKCNLCSLQNCLNCDETGKKCLQCSANYKLFNGVCTQCGLDNCALCLSTDSNKCQYCSDNYYLKSDFTCAKCIDNCKACWGSTGCLQCQTNYYYNNGNCYQCSIQNCISCESNNICKQCGTGYFLTNNLCAKCISNCDNCTDSTTCTKCSNGFLYNTVTKICDKCDISNCKSCSKTDVCETCIDGTYYNPTNKNCDICPSNCLTCSSTQTCTKCNVGYYLSQNTCQKCTISNCKACSGEAVCTECLTDYTINQNNQCSFCPYLNTCSKCNVDNQCSQCLSGFLLQNSLCISCKANCIECSVDGKCSKCNSGFYLIESSNECSPCSLNCDKCTSPTVCTNCKTGFSLNSTNYCVKCDLKNCLKCEKNDQCSQCTTGYSLNTNDFTCGCAATQYFDELSNSCKECNKFSNCFSCDSTICKKCNSNYYFTSTGVCTKCPFDQSCGECTATSCTKCASNHYLSSKENNTCSKCFIDCESCVSPQNNQCTGCFSGYVLDTTTNQCVTPTCPANINCKYCTRDLDTLLIVCASCNDNYFFNGETCELCHPTCLTCNGRSAKSCLSCPSYAVFFRESGTCGYLCHSSCLTCNGNANNNCLTCLDNNVLWNNTCISINAGRINLIGQVPSNLEIGPLSISTSLALKSFVQKTSNVKFRCTNNNDCYNNGECLNSVCSNCNGFLGLQCQISPTDLSLAIGKKDDIVNNLNTLIKNNNNIANLTLVKYALQTTTELTSILEIWSTQDTVKTIANILTNLTNLSNFYSDLDYSKYSINSLSNLVFFINNYNQSAFNIDSTFKSNFLLNTTLIIDNIVKSKFSQLTKQGDQFQLNTPYYSFSLNYIELAASNSPKFTLYSTSYYDVNDPYQVQIGLTGDSVSLITKINGGNSKIILKTTSWSQTNPFPADESKQTNLTLVTGIAGVQIYKTNGELLNVAGLTDPVAIRILKVNPSSALDTSNTLERYVCAYWDPIQLLWQVTDIRNDKTTDSLNYIGCYTTHFTDFSVFYSNKTNFFALEFVESQLWYVRSNYGFIGCIIILVLTLIIIPAIIFTKREQGGFKTRAKPGNTYKTVNELERNVMTTENEDRRGEINLNTFESYGKIENKKIIDSLNHWMLFPIYSILFTESPAVAVQKYTVLLINLMVFLTILAFCFADYTIPSLKDKGVFAGFSFCAILVSWFTNYIFGSFAWSMRKKDNFRVNLFYWPIFFLVWIVLSIFISWRMADVGNEYSNYWILSIAICVVFDLFLFDLFLVTVAKEVGSNPNNLQKLTKFLRLRGYYD